MPLGATCASSSTMIRSWSGEITLSSDSPTGDVVMDMVLDNYTDRGALTFHREVHDLVLTDVMTPLIAAQTVAKQKETAIARAADERNRQIRADIDAKADALLPQMEARAERVKPIITLHGYAIQPIIDPVALSAGQPCGGDFQKLKGVVEDAWKFHADVQSRRLADYPKAAPHEKNTVVAVLYSEARAVNKRALKVAAHLAICDREGLLDADKAYLDVTFDEEEATRVMRFLNKE